MATTMNKEANKLTVNTSDELAFYCNDGRVLRNLQELADALYVMSEDTYRYHSNDSKNDFAAWVRDVFGDARLSNELLRSSSRKQAADKVAHRVASLTSK
jgi:hypothetical protein